MSQEDGREGKGLHRTLSGRRNWLRRCISGPSHLTRHYISDIAIKSSSMVERQTINLNVSGSSPDFKQAPVAFNTGELRIPSCLTVNIQLTDYYNTRSPNRRNPNNQPSTLSWLFVIIHTIISKMRYVNAPT